MGKGFLIFVTGICFVVTTVPAYGQIRPDQPATADQIYRQTSQARMVNESRTKVITESFKIKDDPIKMVKYGQFPENRGAALNYIGAMCDAGKQKEEHIEAIRYVIKHERDTAVLALAFSYLGFCNSNAETDSKLFDMIKIGVQIDKVQKAASIIPNITDFIPYMDEYNPIKNDTERCYVLINGAIKGLVLSKTTGSTGLLEKLNQHYISNKNLMRRSSYELDSYISRIQANLLEGIASKIQNYGNRSALDYFNKQITYSNLDQRYDRLSKGLITISLAQMDCHKASLWDSFKPGCVDFGNNTNIADSLKNIVASSAWPVEFRAMAYKYLIKYVPESDIMGADGKVRTLVGNRNYKAEIDFALEDKKLTEGTESMMAFVASWFMLDAIAVELIPRTIPIFKKLHGLVKEIFPEIKTIGEAENVAVKVKEVASGAKDIIPEAKKISEAKGVTDTKLLNKFNYPGKSYDPEVLSVMKESHSPETINGMSRDVFDQNYKTAKGVLDNRRTAYGGGDKKIKIADNAKPVQADFKPTNLDKRATDIDRIGKENLNLVRTYNKEINYVLEEPTYTADFSAYGGGKAELDPRFEYSDLVKGAEVKDSKGVTWMYEKKEVINEDFVQIYSRADNPNIKAYLSASKDVKWLEKGKKMQGECRVYEVLNKLNNKNIEILIPNNLTRFYDTDTLYEDILGLVSKLPKQYASSIKEISFMQYGERMKGMAGFITKEDTELRLLKLNDDTQGAVYHEVSHLFARSIDRLRLVPKGWGDAIKLDNAGVIGETAKQAASGKLDKVVQKTLGPIQRARRVSLEDFADAAADYLKAAEDGTLNRFKTQYPNRSEILDKIFNQTTDAALSTSPDFMYFAAIGASTGAAFKAIKSDGNNDVSLEIYDVVSKDR